MHNSITSRLSIALWGLWFMNESLVMVPSWDLSLENIPWLPGIYMFSWFFWKLLECMQGKQVQSSIKVYIYMLKSMGFFSHGQMPFSKLTGVF